MINGMEGVPYWREILPNARSSGEGLLEQFRFLNVGTVV